SSPTQEVNTDSTIAVSKLYFKMFAFIIFSFNELEVHIKVKHISSSETIEVFWSERTIRALVVLVHFHKVCITSLFKTACFVLYIQNVIDVSKETNGFSANSP